MSNPKYKNRIIRKIYREKDINEIDKKINKLGSSFKIDAVTFMNIRLLSTIIVFFIVLYNTKLGYLVGPILTVCYYYFFEYFIIETRLKKRINKLDRESLYFFEILTLTLESGRNLEKSLEITVDNVDSEISNEFKKSLLEMKYGKSLIESLTDMKERIPSETVNNIILNITQTNVFGNSILSTMYGQVEYLREKQILEIKGQINKIPNKISIVSVVFVLPLILMLILGPFIINFLG